MKLLIAITIFGIVHAYPSSHHEQQQLHRSVDNAAIDERISKAEVVVNNRGLEKIKSEKSDATKTTAEENPLTPLTKLCIAIELKELYESQIVKDLDEEAESEKDKRGLLEKLKAIDDAYPDKSLMPIPDESLVKDLVEDLCQKMEDFFEDAFPDVKVGSEVERSMRKLAVLHALRK